MLVAADDLIISLSPIGAAFETLIEKHVDIYCELRK